MVVSIAEILILFFFELKIIFELTLDIFYFGLQYEQIKI